MIPVGKVFFSLQFVVYFFPLQPCPTLRECEGM